MEYIQFSLTVNEGKWLIAHGISQMPEVQRAMEHGKVVFKAGTTVSCVSQLLTGIPLRICGRISTRGTVSSRTNGSAAHLMLYTGGQSRSLDEEGEDALLELGPDDVMITGANLLDCQGNAAMLGGSPAGNFCGKAVSAMTCEGFSVIVAAGLEKLTPTPVRDSMLHARRQGVDRSMGMSCGLFPVFGRVITELEAVRLIADVEICLIGRGGIEGAEGGCVFQAWGEPEELHKLEDVLRRCRNQPLGGDAESLVECQFPCSGCGPHRSCCYKAAYLAEKRK